MEGVLHYEFGELIFGRHIFGILLYAGFIVVECLICTNVFTSMHIMLKKKCQVVLLGRCRVCIESTFFHHFNFMSLIKL